MEETYDPKRDPEMVSHYMGHALSRARIEIIKGLEQSAKQYLREKLKNLYDDGSKKYKLAQRILESLSPASKWTTIEEVDKFHEEYKRLRLEILQ